MNPVRRWTRPETRYGNKQASCGIHSHGSKLESAVCQILQFREKAKEIKLLQIQDHVYLSLAKIVYVADFKCLDLGSDREFWVEAKGYANDKWPIKKKLWKFYGPGKLEIWTGSYQKPMLDEVIEPQMHLAGTCPKCGGGAA